MAYTYPDKNDRITIQLISSVSRGSYWADSETRVLNMALEQIRGLDRPRSMLDLGCGLGRLFRVFAPETDSILGLEPDSERFAGALKSAEDIAEAQCRVINSDSSVLAEEDRFDIILSSHVFQHIPPALCEEMADTIAAHLRPGGLTILTTTHADSREDIFTVETMDGDRRTTRPVTVDEFGTFFDMDGILPVRLFAENTIIAMFRRRGFEPVLCRTFHFDGAESVEYDDAAAEEAANVPAEERTHTGGRDCMYIFRRV